MAKAAKKKTRPKDALAAYILLDRSGSMGGKWLESLSAIDGYVKSLTGKAVATLCVFDHAWNRTIIDVLRDEVAPNAWRPVSPTEAEPRGLTPLYDAIGDLVSRAEEANPSKAVLVIVTDGLENQSRLYKREHAKEALDRCRARGWQVLFIGADFDAMPQAAEVGTSLQQTINYRPGAFGNLMQGLAASTMQYATSGATMSFTEEDRARAQNKASAQSE